MRKALVLHGLVVTTVYQASGAPVIDPCGGHTQEGQGWRGYALHLMPWRKDRYGDRLAGLALCVGKVT